MSLDSLSLPGLGPWLAGGLLAALSVLGVAQAQDGAPGYTDTPRLPDSPWRVHDATRPAPPVVAPGAPTSAPPPADAIVLFDGTDLSAWRAESGGEAAWKLGGDWMEVAAGTGAIETREAFGDCQLHLEWRAPLPATGDGQARGNSGLFLMGRYEVQVLDSFENRTYADGQAAALYGQWPPLVNACRPPGEWQSFDVVFRAPRFDGDALVGPARITVLHNGVLVHASRAFLGATAHRRVGTYAPHASAGPLRLQDHGDPVRFRNVWIRRLELD